MLCKKDHRSFVLPEVCPSLQIQESGENELAGILKCGGDTTVLKIDLVWLCDDLGDPDFVCVVTQEHPKLESGLRLLALCNFLLEKIWDTYIVCISDSRDR